MKPEAERSAARKEQTMKTPMATPKPRVWRRILWQQ